MPTDQEIDEITMRELGVDPTKYQLDEVGNLRPKVVTQPTSGNNIAVQAEVPKEESSVLGAGGRALGRGVLPAYSAWAAGSGAAALSTPLALRLSRIPYVGPAAGILTPIVAGLAAGAGAASVADTAQDFVMDKVAPAFKQRLDQQMQIDREQHPIPSILGTVAANIPGGRPTLENITSLRSLARKVPDMLMGNKPQVAANEIGALVNTGVGVGLPVAEAYRHGQDIVSPEVAGNIAANMFFSPREHLGGHPPQEKTVSGRTLDYKPTGKNLEITRIKQAPAPDEAGFMGPPDVQHDPIMDLQKQREAELVQADQAVHEAQVKAKLTEAEVLNAKADEYLAANQTDPNKIKFQAERQTDEEPVIGAAPVEDAIGRAAKMPPNKRGTVTADEINKKVGATKDIPFATPLPAEPLIKTQTDKAIPPFMKQLGKERDVNLDTSPTEILDGKGNRVRGVSYTDPNTGERVARVNSLTPDTYPHEIAHPWLQDVAETQPKLYARIERQLKDTQAYRDFKAEKIAKGQDSSMEEFLAEGIGKKTIDNLSNSKNEGPIKDAISAFKARTGNPDEIINMLSRRLRYDAPSGEWRVPQGKVLNPSPITKHQNDGEDKGAVHAFDWDIMGDGSKVLKMYNATKDIVDPKTGEVMHPKDSTIAQSTLDKYGVKYQPEEDNMPDWTREEMKSRGLDPARKLNDVDLGNQSVVDAIKSDPTLAAEQKARLLKTGSIKSPFDEMREHVDEQPGPTATPAPPKPSREEAAKSRADKDMGKATRLAYQPEDSGDEFAPTSPNTRDESKQGFFENFAGQFDKVAKHSKEISEALKNWAARKDKYLGEWRNSLLKDLKPHSLEDVKAANQYRRDMFRTGKSDIELTPEQEAIATKLGDMFTKVRDTQNQEGMLIDGRKAGSNQYYTPDMFNDTTLDLFRNKPDSQATRDAKGEWLQYLKDNGVTADTAKEMIRDYVNAIGAQKKGTTDFGALRRPQGFGIPESLRESDPIKLVRKYAERSAKDIAFYKEIENNPDISAKLLDRTSNDYMGGIPDVQNAMKFVYNDFHYTDPKIAAASRVVTNLMLGIKTGITDTLSIPSLAATYFKRPGDFKTLFTALAHLPEAREASVKTNARNGKLDMLAWHNVESPDATVKLFNKIAEGARKVQLRDALEQGNRIYTFAIGRELAKENYYKLLEGDNGAAEFMEKFGRLTNVEALKNGEVEGQDLQDSFDQVAKNFVDRNQGTYDGRGLPSNIMEGPMAPFVTLAKWNIEKSNVVWQDVVKPLQKGDIKPLLAYTAGTMLTATAIQQIAELLTGKKQQNASFSEAAAADNKEQMLASVINLAQQGSLAGIISDMAKIGSDTFIQGQKPQSIAKFPLYDAATSMGEELAMIVEAYKSGHMDLGDAAMTLVRRLAMNNVQNARIAMSHLSKDQEDKNERSNKFRDARVFKKLSGEQVPDTRDLQVNEYDNPQARRFKQTPDLAEAASLAPKLLGQAVADAHDPIELKQEFEKLKRNSYQTMPDPQTDPLKFGKFYQWLIKTEGQKEADNRVTDYFTQRAINKAKGHMVP